MDKRKLKSIKTAIKAAREGQPDKPIMINETQTIFRNYDGTFTVSGKIAIECRTANDAIYAIENLLG